MFKVLLVAVLVVFVYLGVQAFLPDVSLKVSDVSVAIQPDTSVAPEERFPTMNACENWTRFVIECD